MVEMVETAASSTRRRERSLVILDEIGRGTATFDGLSIAWAVVEYLHEVNQLPRAVRHALPRADRARRPPAARSPTSPWTCKEWRDEIVFLHKVKPGAADRSYGIQVAKLAGLPKPVTARAGEVLALLEKSEQGAGRRRAAQRTAAVCRRASDVATCPRAGPVRRRGGA